ncbi:hypothetical protein [Duodenibacillus massiliensis]|uniref:hypothetical protein n=1 Tax=Duodenibacillus massiliensis TaxID=1852381 RepID=UPI003C6CEFD4
METLKRMRLSGAAGKQPSGSMRPSGIEMDQTVFLTFEVKKNRRAVAGRGQSAAGGFNSQIA